MDRININIEEGRGRKKGRRNEPKLPAPLAGDQFGGLGRRESFFLGERWEKGRLLGSRELNIP